MRVVVLGGYGSFGTRICRSLAGDAEIELVIAGRNEARAAAFAATLPGTRSVIIDKDTINDQPLEAGEEKIRVSADDGVIALRDLGDAP